MDEVEQAVVDEYPWPCDRRVAHGPHEDVNTLGMSDEAMAIAIMRPSDEPSCPGVNAHPLCMIGRK